MQKYAQGLGIDCDSPTKVYIAPKIDVDRYGGNSFQETFFTEFSKGDITVQAAAKTAYEAWKKNQINPDKAIPMNEFIGICGNANLTLTKLRENLALRQTEPTQSVLLLIDGMETCNGDPVKAATSFNK